MRQDIDPIDLTDEEFEAVHAAVVAQQPNEPNLTEALFLSRMTKKLCVKYAVDLWNEQKQNHIKTVEEILESMTPAERQAFMEEILKKKPVTANPAKT